MACKYCGDSAQGRVDGYGEDECAECASFFAAAEKAEGYNRIEHSDLPGVLPRQITTPSVLPGQNTTPSDLT